jgi:hypothetical protein
LTCLPLPLIGRFRDERAPLPADEFISLPEAVTWLMFGTAMTHHEIRRRRRSRLQSDTRQAKARASEDRVLRMAQRLERIMADECSAGRTIIKGVPNFGKYWAVGAHQDIDPNWFVGGFSFEADAMDGRLEPCPPGRRPSYGRCRIARTEVLRWEGMFDSQSDASSEKSEGRNTGRYSAQNLQIWYNERIGNWPPGTPLPSENTDWEAAEKAFPAANIPRSAIRNVRREAPRPYPIRRGRPARAHKR